jgi:hypothetical protein
MNQASPCSPGTPAKVSNSSTSNSLSENLSIYCGGINFIASGRIGWDKVNADLCSVVARHEALPLLLQLEYMNDGNGNKSAEEFASKRLEGLASFSYMDNLNIVDVFGKALQGLQDTTDELETAVKNWKGNEKALTRALAEAMQKCEMNREMHSLYESHVDGVGCGYMDNLLASRDDCMPVALFEFGLSGREHWQKINQGDLYLNGLESASKSAASPKKRKQSTDNKVRPSCFGDKPVLLTTVNYEKELKDCKISVFFCWCKGEKSHLEESVSKILLWRKHTPSCSARALAEQLANIVVVARCLRSWHTVECDSHLFEVLSPVCCKVKHKHVSFCL